VQQFSQVLGGSSRHVTKKISDVIQSWLRFQFDKLIPSPPTIINNTGCGYLFNQVIRIFLSHLSSSPHFVGFRHLLIKSRIIERFATMDAVTELLEHDVLLGRSPPVYRNEGNQRFRALVDSYRPAHEEASLPDKRVIVQQILKEWKERGPRGRFLSIVKNGDSSLYAEEDDKIARQTIAQCFQTLKKAAIKAQAVASRKTARSRLGEVLLGESAAPAPPTPMTDPGAGVMFHGGALLHNHADSTTPTSRRNFFKTMAPLKRMEQPAPREPDFDLDIAFEEFFGSVDTRSAVDNRDQAPQDRYSFWYIHSHSALRLRVEGNEDANSLARELKTNTSLTTVHLRCRLIRDDGAAAIADSLAANSTLEVLSIEGFDYLSRIGGDSLCLAAAALATSLRRNSTLKKLDLSGTGIGSAGAIAMANSLSSMRLSELRLTWNGIDNHGACAIANALIADTHLKVLKLCHNSIGGPGVSAVADSLRKNTTLKTLDLRGNAIGGSCWSTITCFANTALKALHLDGCGFGNGAESGLTTALHVNSTTALEVLTLGDNELGNDDAVALANALKVNFFTALRMLWLTDNGIGDDSAFALASALKVNLTLTKLDMGLNRIGHADRVALSAAWSPRDLETLSLRFQATETNLERQTSPNMYTEQQTALILLNDLQNGATRNSKPAAGEQLAASPDVDSEPPDVVETEDASEVVDDSEQPPSILERFRMICLAFASGIPVNEKEEAFRKSATAAGLGRCRHPRDLNIDEKVRLYRLAVDHGIPLNNADQAFLQMVNQGN
jgi:Ran GTPase-activating protein (RanGAP) involved in mRNA processing and transport